MNRKLAFFLVLVLFAGALTGCTGTTVVYQTNCDCPDDISGGAATDTYGENVAVTEGALKTGLAIVAGASGESASAIEYDVSVVAVTVDDNGVIASCIIDSLVVLCPQVLRRLGVLLALPVGKCSQTSV